MRYIIFDFDGVIVDTFNSLYGLNKAVLKSIGINFSETDYRNCFKNNFHLSIKEFIGDELLYNKYLKLRKDNFHHYYSDPELFNGAIDFLREIAGRAKLAIVSSTEKEVIRRTLEKHGIETIFDRVFGSNNFSKKMILIKIGARWKVPLSKIVLVSDTSGDIVVAKNLGLKAAGVLWGYHGYKELKATQPDFLAHNFSELSSWFTASS